MVIAQFQARSREPRLDPGLIETAKAILQDAVSLDAALLSLGKSVAPRLDVWRISVRMIDWERRDMVIVGVWARAGTALEVGTSFPATHTALPDILKALGPVIREGTEETPSLLHQILASEAMRSSVSIPLYQSRMIAGVLALSSIDLRAFTQEDVPFYTTLGEEVEGLVLRLVRWSGRFTR
jgi:uncharacterized protein YigA (DUF484 family)